MRSRLLLIPLAALVLQLRLGAAEPLKMDIIVRLDSYGDGTMEVQTRLSAMAWRQWEQVYGNHPDLILRNLKRQFASYDLDNDSYRLEKDQVKRVATARMRCRALAVLQKDGSLSVPLPKPFRLVTHSAHEWIFSLNTPESGASPPTEQTTRIFLPEGETDAQIQYADTADQRLAFRMPPPKTANPAFLVGGSVLGGLGIVFLVGSFLVPKQKGPGAAKRKGSGAIRGRPVTTAPVVTAPERN